MPEDKPDLTAAALAASEAKHKLDLSKLEAELAEAKAKAAEYESKIKEGESLLNKLTGDVAVKEAADKVTASIGELRTKLIAEGVPSDVLKFAESERELKSLSEVYKAARVPRGNRLETGGGSTPSAGKPSFDRRGIHFKDLKKWADAETTRVRQKFNI